MRRNRIRLLLLLVFGYTLLSYLMVNKKSSTQSQEEYTLADEEEADERFRQLFGGGGITGPAALANEKRQLQQSCSQTTDKCCTDSLGPVIQPLTPPNCPDRYVLFGSYGNFNNGLRSLIQTIILGAAMNRTVLLLTAEYYRFKWETMFQWNETNICIRLMDPRAFANTYLSSSQMTVTYWDGESNSQEESLPSVLGSAKSNSIGLQDPDGLLAATPPAKPRINCVAKLARDQLLHNTDPLVFIPRTFFTANSPKHYTRILKRLKLPRAARRLADEFIQETRQKTALFRSIQGKFNYVGVHLRSLEGECHRWANEVFQMPELRPYLNDSLAQCDMKWPYLAKVITEYGHDPDTIPIFLGTDNQRPELTKELLSHPNVFMRETGNNNVVDDRMVDMVLMMRSFLFIGLPLSSLSFNVAMWRESNGFAANTNVAAGYREVGYFHHLFVK